MTNQSPTVQPPLSPVEIVAELLAMAICRKIQQEDRTHVSLDIHAHQSVHGKHENKHNSLSQH